MRSVKILLVLAVFGLCGVLAWRFLLRETARDGAPPPPPPATSRLEPEVRDRLERVADLEASDALRLAIEEHRGGPEEMELRALFRARAEGALANLRLETERLLLGFHYRGAAQLAEAYAREWRASPIEEQVAEVLQGIRDEQTAQVEARAREADELVEAGRYEAARESLVTGLELETPFALLLVQHAERIERRIRARSPSGFTRPVAPGTVPGAAATTVREEPPPPPALPAFPHPDVKRLRDARELYAKARDLFRKRRYHPAAEALDDLVGYYADLQFLKDREAGIAALNTLSRHGAAGVGGLFHATVVKRNKGGRRIRLEYAFKEDAEMLDWEEMPTIPHEADGSFGLRRGAVHGYGTTSFLLRAFFENDVTIRCSSRPKQVRSHGLGFCQAGLETRQVLLLVTNHWFTEGENYVKERPGHSLLLIGKGTNADVPVDAPEVGFVFKGPSAPRPSPPDGGELQLSLTMKGNRMSGEVAYRSENASLRQEALGDDGRGFERLRPALFVVEADVMFREVVVEGTLHDSFESRRVDELLNQIRD